MYIYKNDQSWNGSSPLLKEEIVKFVTFPSGERMPTLPDSFNSSNGVRPITCFIEQSIRTANDLLDIAMVVDCIRRVCLGTEPPRIHLRASYIMGARQDRVCSSGQPLTASVIANMINVMGFVTVTTDNPHSDVLPALINNCIVRDRIVEMVDTFFDNNPLFDGGDIFIVAPDAGATKRTQETLQYVNRYLDAYPNGVKSKAHFIQGEKRRDPSTGKISGFKCSDVEIGKDDLVIVIDDVCGFGGTFLGLADQLIARGAKSHNMAILVAHADCSSGLVNVLSKYQNGVYTTTDTDECRAVASDSLIYIVGGQD